VVADVHVLAVSELPGLLESYKEQHSLLELVQKGVPTLGLYKIFFYF